ncbi:MAG: L-seryl-tRNA(Sec) selenium transferase [Desulfuromonadales bacterium]|nr:L-seryl-tRNA(Sec) selenium transferase [Desulfuromonadales bacterium]
MSVQVLLKQIPKVDRVLGWPEIAPLLEQFPRSELLRAIRTCLDRFREQLITGDSQSAPEPHLIVAVVRDELSRRKRMNLQPVINGTGVVIHTNLGRSPLASLAEEAIHSVSQGYSNLEYNLANGDRGGRTTHVEGLIRELTGAEVALVVNNNAAAVMLALSTLAVNREVIVSRGELVEIGGSFRIPDVMRHSGATLVEVGATNRTHVSDYHAALSDSTALLLKVHASNFAIVGFTAEVTLDELVIIGRERGIPVMFDAGSGCLVDLTPHGIRGEPTVSQLLAQGADIVTFSGDKLLGGPQAGIIAGRRDLLEPMKRHPLMRAFRADKLSLAALEATLRLYRDEYLALREVPTLRMLTMTRDELSRWAGLIIRRLKRLIPAEVMFYKQKGESSAGGGSVPLLQLPTTLIEIRIQDVSPSQIEAALRRAATPVIGRIHQNRFLLDVRTIADRDILALTASIREAVTALTRKDQ